MPCQEFTYMPKINRMSIVGIGLVILLVASCGVVVGQSSPDDGNYGNYVDDKIDTSGKMGIDKIIMKDSFSSPVDSNGNHYVFRDSDYDNENELVKMNGTTAVWSEDLEEVTTTSNGFLGVGSGHVAVGYNDEVHIDLYTTEGDEVDTLPIDVSGTSINSIQFVDVNNEYITYAVSTNDNIKLKRIDVNTGEIDELYNTDTFSNSVRKFDGDIYLMNGSTFGKIGDFTGDYSVEYTHSTSVSENGSENMINFDPYNDRVVINDNDEYQFRSMSDGSKEFTVETGASDGVYGVVSTGSEYYIPNYAFNSTLEVGLDGSIVNNFSVPTSFGVEGIGSGTNYHPTMVDSRIYIGLGYFDVATQDFNMYQTGHSASLHSYYIDGNIYTSSSQQVLKIGYGFNSGVSDTTLGVNREYLFPSGVISKTDGSDPIDVSLDGSGGYYMDIIDYATNGNYISLFDPILIFPQTYDYTGDTTGIHVLEKVDSNVQSLDDINDSNSQGIVSVSQDGSFDISQSTVQLDSINQKLAHKRYSNVGEVINQYGMTPSSFSFDSNGNVSHNNIDNIASNITQGKYLKGLGLSGINRFSGDINTDFSFTQGSEGGNVQELGVSNVINFNISNYDNVSDGDVVSNDNHNINIEEKEVNNGYEYNITYRYNADDAIPEVLENSDAEEIVISNITNVNGAGSFDWYNHTTSTDSFEWKYNENITVNDKIDSIEVNVEQEQNQEIFGNGYEAEYYISLDIKEGSTQLKGIDSIMQMNLSGTVPDDSVVTDSAVTTGVHERLYNSIEDGQLTNSYDSSSDDISMIGAINNRVVGKYGNTPLGEFELPPLSTQSTEVASDANLPSLNVDAPEFSDGYNSEYMGVIYNASISSRDNVLINRPSSGERYKFTTGILSSVDLKHIEMNDTHVTKTYPDGSSYTVTYSNFSYYNNTIDYSQYDSTVPVREGLVFDRDVVRAVVDAGNNVQVPMSRQIDYIFMPQSTGDIGVGQRPTVGPNEYINSSFITTQTDSDITINEIENGFANISTIKDVRNDVGNITTNESVLEMDISMTDDNGMMKITIDDLIPDSKYMIYQDGEVWNESFADENGEIILEKDGGWSEHRYEIVYVTSDTQQEEDSNVISNEDIEQVLVSTGSQYSKYLIGAFAVIVTLLGLIAWKKWSGDDLEDFGD